MRETDYLVIGAGIMGLSVARELTKRFPGTRITILEKEKEVGLHASGRNSGIIHAGFYYTEDSLKAKFTRDGNRQLTDYCVEKGIPINTCGKVVVARDSHEDGVLHELDRRGKANGVDVRLVDTKELEEIEPNAKTYNKALYSPTTSSVDPAQVCQAIAEDLGDKAEVVYGCSFVKRSCGAVETNNGRIAYNYLINTAGLYAGKIAHDFGVGTKYAIVPFKGVYLGYAESTLLRTHVYPVPNLKNPFLGVHLTKTVDGKVKIGPTSMPALCRENYGLFEGLMVGELVDVVYREAMLFLRSKTFRSLAYDEVKKYYRKHLVNQACELIKARGNNGFGKYLRSGIRAQLLDTRSLELVMDFKVEHKDNTIHILNAVSPAFTCAFSFARYIVDEIEKGS